MSDLELQALLGFNEEDLIANRGCRLSARQQEQINKSERLNQRLFAGTGVTLILIAVGNTYAVVSNAIKHEVSFFTALHNDMISLLASISIPGLLLGFLAWGSFKMAATNVDHSVQQIRGKVNLAKVKRVFSEKMPNGSMYYRTVETYELRVGKVNFENVNQGILNFLKEGDIYAFYYTKDSKDILSVELIAKGK